MLFEFYNTNGDLVLDNESHVTRYDTKLGITPETRVYIGFQHNTPAGWWHTNHSYGEIFFNGRILKNPTGAPNTYTNYSVVPYPERREMNIYDEQLMVWGQVSAGSGLCLSTSFISYFCVTNTTYAPIGVGAKLAFTKKAPATDASGYLDCFAEDGSLMWSLNSLLKVPQILEVLNVANGAVVDLGKYPTTIREKIYFFSAHPGTFTPPSYYSGQVMGYGAFSATNIFREGNLVYVTNQYPLPGVAVLVAYIPDG